jgi:hypothetical protein
VGTETLQTVFIFSLGYICCLAVRKRRDLARHAYRMACLANSFVAWLGSVSGALTAKFANVDPRRWSFCQPAWLSKGVLAIILAGTLCSVCIISLLVSAFTAEPDLEPADSGLASESSTLMRVFTVGWMFILSFKLRRELVGLVGSCCLLQPW